MALIGIIVRPGVERALSLAEELVGWAKQNGHALACDQESAQLLGLTENIFEASELTERADPIVTLGGDGTLIGIARHVSNKSPVMLGVNFGHLGFLTEIAPRELVSTLEAVINGEALIGSRAMLSAEVLRNGSSIFSGQAVNDAVVQKGTRDGLVELDVSVDSNPVARIRADGLIVATPTGSTAYSLAAGGSIVYPLLSAMLLTPICAHSLTARPFILPLEFDLKISIPNYEGEVFITLDGQSSIALQSSDEIVVRKSPSQVRFVRSPSKSYFDILTTKLHWAVPNRPE